MTIYILYNWMCDISTIFLWGYNAEKFIMCSTPCKFSIVKCLKISATSGLLPIKQGEICSAAVCSEGFLCPTPSQPLSVESIRTPPRHLIYSLSSFAKRNASLRNSPCSNEAEASWVCIVVKISTFWPLIIWYVVITVINVMRLAFTNYGILLLLVH